MNLVSISLDVVYDTVGGREKVVGRIVPGALESTWSGPREPKGENLDAEL